MEILRKFSFHTSSSVPEVESSRLLYFLIPRDVESFGSLGRGFNSSYLAGVLVHVVIVLVHQTVGSSLDSIA